MNTAVSRFKLVAACLVMCVTATLTSCGGDQPEGGGGETGAAVAQQPATTTASGGEALYQRCITCHQANGEGAPGVYPPLKGSEYATAANVAVPISIVIRGMQGPVTVAGAEYNGVMPAYGTGIEMTDDEVATVLTYVRRSWGNAASPVTPADVAKVRSAGTAGAVTVEELKPMM